jgi:hypothetical protein
MILNISRIKEFKQCSMKTKYHQIDGLEENSIAIPLMTGGAFHEGAAEFLAHRNVKTATQTAEAKYRERLVGQMILPEERQTIEQQIELSKRMVDVFASNFSDHEMTVISPEVEFCVAMPDTLHHCHFIHNLIPCEMVTQEHQEWMVLGGQVVLHNINGCGTQTSEFQLLTNGWVCLCGKQIPRCIQPHYFRGKTDAVISWKGKIWLLEHKTTAMTGNIFYDKFMLDFQTTGYLYGIGKALGTRPHGFLLNVLKKPNKNAKDQLSVSFEREPYLRSDEDIQRFEREFIHHAEDYEHAVTNNRWAMDGAWNESCVKYNRRCYFWDVCKNHGRIVLEQFRTKTPDYVDEQYYKILGLTPPERCQASMEVTIDE